jgi:CBS domain-containing protein
MRVKDAMTKWAFTIKPEASIKDAAKIMLEMKVSGLPVLDKDGSLIGIVSEGDLLRRNELRTQRKRPRSLEIFLNAGILADEYTKSHSTKVIDIMTPNPRTTTEDTLLTQAVDEMEHYQIKRLPVVREGKVIGILTRTNVLQALIGLIRDVEREPAADWAIRDHILAEIQKNPWAPKQAINVTVHRGVVDLWGTIFDDRQRKALLVAAQSTPGVARVSDHLAVVPVHHAIPF